MEVVLTKDADKMICALYKTYLDRRKDGAPKNQAADFTDIDTWGKELFPEWNLTDVKSTACEMTKAFGIKPYISMGFHLNDTAIIYMENRFPRGLEHFMDVVGKVKNIIPWP